ncbi:MAG: glycine cleavage system protein H [Clostridiales bacterium]
MEELDSLRDYQFTKSHEWVRFLNDHQALIGITHHGQKLLGDLVYITLPADEEEIEAGEAFAELASARADSDVYCPVSGRITKVNMDLLTDPNRITKNPYEAWMIEVSEITDHETLLEAGDYQQFLDTEQ